MLSNVWGDCEVNLYILPKTRSISLNSYSNYTHATKASFLNYSETHGKNQFISEKIRESILQQLLEIIDKFEPNAATLDKIFKWSVRQLKTNTSGVDKAPIGRKLLQIVFKISNMQSTSTIYLKHILMDFEHFSHEASNNIVSYTILLIDI